MQQSEYEKGLLVQASWRLARSNDINELMAVACTIRNWVITKHYPGISRHPMGHLSQIYYGTFSEAIEAFYEMYPDPRPSPAIDEPALIDPMEGLLLKIDEVYNCSMADFTSSKAFPGGARYFARNGGAGWIKEEIVCRREEHPLIGTFGGQQFYA